MLSLSFLEITNQTIEGDVYFLFIGYMLLFSFVQVMLGRFNFIETRVRSQGDFENYKKMSIISTLASECLLLEEKINEPYHLKYASHMTHEFLYDNSYSKNLAEFSR